MCSAPMLGLVKAISWAVNTFAVELQQARVGLGRLMDNLVTTRLLK